jgi:hypothetical protein
MQPETSRLHPGNFEHTQYNLDQMSMKLEVVER